MAEITIRKHKVKAASAAWEYCADWSKALRDGDSVDEDEVEWVPQDGSGITISDESVSDDGTRTYALISGGNPGTIEWEVTCFMKTVNTPVESGTAVFVFTITDD